MLRYLNSTVVFLLELAMLASSALFGYHTGNNVYSRIGLTILFPALVILVWGYWGAPKSVHRLKMPYQIFFRLVMFLSASLLFYLCGSYTTAYIMAILSVVTQTVSFLTENE